MRAFLLAAALIAGPAFAQPQPACIRAEIMPGFEAWARGGPGAAIAVGGKAALTLAPAAGVRFDPAPARPLAAGTFADQFPLTIAKAGTYSIALSGKAWIEVTRAGKRLTSVAHQEGKICSGIRKIVDFALTPGTYRVQLSEAVSPSLAVLVVAKR